MKDEEILNFIYERLIHRHKENSNVDYMINFKRIINQLKEDKKSEKEIIINQALIDARNIQDFLWGKNSISKETNKEKVKEIFITIMQKRVDKINLIDFNKKNSIVKLRKRLLQQAALSIKYLEILTD